MRAFHDRLIDDTDRSWLKEQLLDLKRTRWRVSGDEELLDSGVLMFGSYLRRGVPPDAQGYEEVPTPRQTLPSLLSEYLSDYNVAHEPLYLSFFWDAVEHISRLARALRSSRGSAMLVGVGGSGQQPISRLGSFICGHTYESVEFRKGYGVTEFREDLKKLYVRTGVKGEPLAVTLTEPEELFLADINTVLNSGEIPDLFTRDEMNSIVADMRPLCTQLGILETRDNIRALFLSRVRANLHLILMFSPGARRMNGNGSGR